MPDLDKLVVQLQANMEKINKILQEHQEMKEKIEMLSLKVEMVQDQQNNLINNLPDEPIINAHDVLHQE